MLEFVEGPTLADRIDVGPIPPDEALPIARQIAEALEAAHEQGIIHRDLKPANIKLRPDGTVKVLDFGLAKARDVVAAVSSVAGPAFGSVGLSNSPTLTTPAMTGIGVILGTAAYMSPGQAKGKPSDKRSDIWAFGCVLYEMLTGRRAFGGDDVSDTIADVLRGEPTWTALPAGTPPEIARLLRRCLAKDLKQRLPDIAVARQEIDETLASPRDARGSVATPARPRLFVSATVVAAVLVGGVGVVGSVARFVSDSTPTSAVVRFALRPGPKFQIGPGVNRPLAAARMVALLLTSSRTKKRRVSMFGD